MPDRDVLGDHAAHGLPDDVRGVDVQGVEQPDGGYWMPLFVKLAPGEELTDELVGELKAAIRTQASPRHVPDEIIAVPGVPHTRTGKRLEVPLKKARHGEADSYVVLLQEGDPEKPGSILGAAKGPGL